MKKILFIIGIIAATHYSLSAEAGLDDYDGNSNNCGCGEGMPTLAESWNDCLACVFVASTNLYNEFTGRLAENGVDPEVDAQNTVEMEGTDYSVNLAASSIDGYERSAVVSKADDDALCLRVEYATQAEDDSRVKFFMQMDTTNCPAGPGDSGSHAMTMKVDLGYADANVQEGQFIELGQQDGGSVGEFDLTQGTDNFFGMNIVIDATSGTPVTNGYMTYLTQNRPWKFFVSGIDDTLLGLGQLLSDGGFSNAVVDGSDFNDTGCFDDSAETAVDDSECADAGYDFDANLVPRTVEDEASKTYPAWTGSDEISSTLGTDDTFDLATLFPDAS